MGWVRVRCRITAGLLQSGMFWYPVITASIYKVAVLVMSRINFRTNQYTNATQNTPHKTTQNKSQRESAIYDSSFSHFICINVKVLGR